MGNTFSQLFPPKPDLTEKNLGDLAGKVYIVTGSNTGVGKELSRLLYSKNATVYIAARSQEKALSAISSIKTTSPDSKGKLTFLHLDLSDLSTVKTAAETFLSQESKLHVLFNNAAVAMPPAGSKSAQGHELQLATNCLGPYMFTRLLTPLLASTAKTEAPNSVRVIWVSSSAAEVMSHNPGGVPLDRLDDLTGKVPVWRLYGISKAGDYLYAHEYARRYGSDGILSVSLNPGNLDSDLGRHVPKAINWVFKKCLLHPPVKGAYTELYAGLSGDIKMASLEGGKWIIPWGRFGTIRKDLVKASMAESEGGSGVAGKFWEWSEQRVAEFV
ncbi:Short-chain dehydrogenase/reductase [Fulvia fulva]|uniref:Short-chain dehydrogenase/reductase n=1 Tax=Passalora fulva TaxID=5499 RepID=A0A9Q8LF39_PASFU|nr:Short-chain dehydrogenase/reductase [Fulvia fulva]KAK4615778.1 Short-chain dehydrogenase/reductase [Fulvia fulva]KAK4616708.1 Short-chain dehydrogenase/reductase [Fulvia fulva]UJO16240.1 Short-chain dehydrogenase/reductase [Fulvia fulva]WPV19253.1 Short-chain dehydrogenase/reductase [Fulvia fulva]WPV34526.1 Short-chain dehydrogenase/reductase [Fulvia fulva]